MTKPLRYFTTAEFDSPDAPGSGSNMDRSFLELLDEARHRAGVPFRISRGGGYRTKEYNRNLCQRNPNASEFSSHMKGCAADIACQDSRQRFLILQALASVGLNRVGIARTFIHVDDDENKPGDLCWTY